MNDPTTDMDLRTVNAEVGLLREALAESAYGITPSHPPLAAIERDGRRIRRGRRATVLGAVFGLLLVPVSVMALRVAGADAHRGTPSVASVTASPPVAAGTVRVVTPSERVAIGPGTHIWLTEDGLHWSEPGAPARTATVTVGHLPVDRPGVELRARGGGDGTGVLFGTYHGRGEAAGVRIETTGHDVEGRTLTLAGHPGWGAWYVHVGGGTGRVTVYDATGKVIAATGRAR